MFAKMLQQRLVGRVFNSKMKKLKGKEQNDIFVKRVCPFLDCISGLLKPGQIVFCGTKPFLVDCVTCSKKIRV